MENVEKVSKHYMEAFDSLLTTHATLTLKN